MRIISARRHQHLVRKKHLRSRTFRDRRDGLSVASECLRSAMRILLYNPDNGVTRNFMPHLWTFLLQALTLPDMKSC